MFLFSCAPTPCREWILVNTITKRPCFNSGRLFLEPDSKSHHIELEISRSASGIHMYLNLLLFPAPPLPEDSSKTCAELIVDGQEPLIFYPYRLSGEQRLLVPDEIAQKIIDLLSENHAILIKVGRDEIQVVSENFDMCYQNLLIISMD